MDKEHFISVSSLLSEPSRTRILWNLLDGRAYTAGELALLSDLSPTSVSNHLSKLLKGHILKVGFQGRHRYYSFANDEVAYVLEAMANLGNKGPHVHHAGPMKENGIAYCRTCYDHLAGYVGVAMTESMEQNAYLKKSDKLYHVTGKGWRWLSQLEITRADFAGSRRPLTRQCLDWSERRSHLAGHLGAVLLQKMLKENWIRKVQFSREMVVTYKGRESFWNQLRINLK